jgi:hypothetical protein
MGLSGLVLQWLDRWVPGYARRMQARAEIHAHKLRRLFDERDRPHQSRASTLQMAVKSETTKARAAISPNTVEPKPTIPAELAAASKRLLQSNIAEPMN